MRSIVVSTPRTGSIFTSEILYHYQASLEKTTHLGEFFNPYHYNLYVETLPDGRRLNHHEPGPNRHKTQPYMTETGGIAYAEVGDRVVNPQIETIRRLAILAQIQTGVVLHYHVHTEGDLEDILMFPWDKIVWCSRRSALQQCMSYAYAYHTKVFRYVQASAPPPAEDIKVDWDVIANLVRRIALFRKEEAEFFREDDGVSMKLDFARDVKYSNAEALSRKLTGHGSHLPENHSVRTPVEIYSAVFPVDVIARMRNILMEAGLQAE